MHARQSLCVSSVWCAVRRSVGISSRRSNLADDAWIFNLLVSREQQHFGNDFCSARVVVGKREEQSSSVLRLHSDDEQSLAGNFARDGAAEVHAVFAQFAFD